MGIHESQSLLWERMIGQSMPFWEYAAAKVHQHFPQTKNARPVDFFQFANIVKPSLIRVDADELTYPLHIVVRPAAGCTRANICFCSRYAFYAKQRCLVSESRIGPRAVYGFAIRCLCVCLTASADS